LGVFKISLKIASTSAGVATSSAATSRASRLIAAHILESLSQSFVTLHDIPRREIRKIEGNDRPVVYVAIGVFSHVKRRKAMSFTLLHEQGDDIRSGLL
jgi:hypothetical protein